MAKANEDVLGLQTPSNGTVTQNSIGKTTPCCGISAQIAQSLDRLTLSVNELKADIKELKEVKIKVDHVQTLQHAQSVKIDGVIGRATKNKQQIEELKAYQALMKEKMDSTEKELKSLKRKTDLMASVMIRQDEQQVNMGNRLTDLQARGMESNLIIHGLEVMVYKDPGPSTKTPDNVLSDTDVEESDAVNQNQNQGHTYAQVVSSPTNTKRIEDCHGTVVQFMKTKLKMRYPPEMVEVHRMGITSKDGTRPMVTKLANPRDKALVFRHVKNLKGVKNNKGSFYFVSDQLPKAVAEFKQQRQLMVRENNKLPPGQRSEMRWHNKQLLIDNQVYHKPICPPSVHDIFKVKDEANQ